MHILVINPNSTAAMTDSITRSAVSVALPDTRITGLNPMGGPASIQGPEDGEACLPGLYDLFEHEVIGKGGYDACIIACFDDTGLQELKRRSPIPVLGIGEAAFHAATLLGKSFAVVTTMAVSVPTIRENIAIYGFSNNCADIRASNIPVLALEEETNQSEQILARAMSAAVETLAPDTVILGCAGMTKIAGNLSRQFAIPVIDGVSAAISIAEALMRLKTSCVE